MSFYKPEGTIGSGMKGQVSVPSLSEAHSIHKLKRDEGLCAKIHNQGIGQADPAQPVTVSWWI